jgi:hypothetical protein
MYTYRIENGTGMALKYVCVADEERVVYRGVLLPSSPLLRFKHGTNPAFQAQGASPFLQCTISDDQNEDAPPKRFLLDARRHNYVTLLSPYPDVDQCAPEQLVFAAKLIQ